MKYYRKALILFSIAILVTSGVLITDNVLSDYLQPQQTSSTVYVENGVSGVVTITDPFLNKKVDINIDYYALDSGSGAIVTKDGYIITAFHVVSDPNSLNNQKILKKMDDDNIKFYLEQEAVTNYLENYNPQLGQELSNNSASNTDTLVEKNNILSRLVQNNLISTKSEKQLIKVKIPSNRGTKTMNAQLVDVGDPGSDEDVALLKINSISKNMSALKISSKQEIGEKIRIYGYPANNEISYSVKPSSSAGYINAKVTNSLSTDYYETDANSAEGYSGGPVLNNKNEVVGILIYGLTSRHFKNGGGSESSLFLSSKYIIDICNKNNIHLNIT